MAKTFLSALALLLFIAALPASAATGIATLGILRGWDWSEASLELLKAGINFKQDGTDFSEREANGVIARTITDLEAMVKTEGAKNAWASALNDIDLAHMDFTELRANLQCTFYETGIEKRDGGGAYKAVSLARNRGDNYHS